MPVVTQCPHCSMRYQVADDFVGKQVRCHQCEGVFVASSAANEAPDPFAASDPLASGSSNPLGATPAMPSRKTSPRVSNPSGGPTDEKMRLVCVGMLVLGLVIVGGSFLLESTTGAVYLGILALAPLVIILGVAGLISPDVVRAVGQYGGHLAWHYKAIGWGLFLLYFVILILLFVGLFFAGFRPDRPGRPRGAAPDAVHGSGYVPA